MNRFQERCVAGIRDRIRGAGKVVEFSEFVGRAETYLRGFVVPNSPSLEIYVYEDELGLMRAGRDWSIAERLDHADQEALLTHFLVELDSHLDTERAE